MLIGLFGFSASAADSEDIQSSRALNECRDHLSNSAFVFGRHPVQVIDPEVFHPAQSSEFLQYFWAHGYVVLDQISQKKNRDVVVERMNDIALRIPEARRLGFMDMYHDRALAELRQEPRLYEAFSLIFNTSKLWVVFDRLLYWNEREGELPLAPHVDQNPIQNPGFFNVQGMLALRDMNENTGTLAIVPNSQKNFASFAPWASATAGFVEYQGESELNFVALRLREGQIVIWDSRITHSRFRAPKQLATRYAALLTFTPASTDPELISLRQQYFQRGTGFNHHAAGLRATARPRYEETLRLDNERFTELGERLYGIQPWP